MAKRKMIPNKNMVNNITADYIRNILDYDHKTGEFFRKPTRADRHCNNGYRRLMVNNQSYMAHRLAWLYMTGRWPVEHIDHINGKRDDNRFENLRDVSIEKNCANRKCSTTNHLQIRGVTLIKLKNSVCYRAQIRPYHRYIHLGTFRTPEEAKAAYNIAARKYFGEDVRTE